jgi:hypothetical protein
MEKSSQMMIDTSSKKKKKSDLNDAQQEADRLVQTIINDDEDMEEHVSAMQLINHFKLYEASLNKYHVSADELFEKLSIKNKKIENYQFS